MKKRIQKWLNSPSIRNHPQLARFLGCSSPGLWSPHRRNVALGVGIGAAISIIPVPGQPFLAALAAMKFRAHLPSAVVLTFLSNPLTTLPLLTIAWMIGLLCLGEPVVWPSGMGIDIGSVAGWIQWIQQAGQPLLIGIPVLAITLGLGSYGLIKLVWRVAIVRRWRNRCAARRP
jgi:uncharacterized protein (DUF2062 family)